MTCPQDGTDVGASWTGAVVMLGQMEWMHVVTEVPAGGPRGVGMTGPGEMMSWGWGWAGVSLGDVGFQAPSGDGEEGMSMQQA